MERKSSKRKLKKKRTGIAALTKAYAARFAAKTLTHNPLEVIGGLEAVEAGFARMRAGAVSATKLVVHVGASSAASERSRRVTLCAVTGQLQLDSLLAADSSSPLGTGKQYLQTAPPRPPLRGPLRSRERRT